MNYSLLTPDEATQELDSLPEDILSSIKKGRGWVMIGQENSQGPVITIAAFKQMTEKAAVELEYIFTRPEYREEGCALGLLEAAGQIFLQNKIEKIVCMPIGSKEQIIDFTQFLILSDFEPLMLDGHIYTYNRQQLMSSNTLKPFLEKSTKNYTHLSQGEIRYYARTMDKDLPAIFHSGLLNACDPEKSIFIIQNDSIYGAVLLSKNETAKKRDELLNIYVNPKWEHPKDIIGMLAHVIKEMAADIVGIDIVVNHEKERQLFDYMLGEPQMDCWVQRYEKDLNKEE